MRKDTTMPKSRFYHTFFEGYTEFTDTDKSGKKRIKRVYTGEYYRQDISKKDRIRLRIAYAVILFPAVLCFIFSAVKEVESNTTGIAAFLNAAECLLLVWQIPGFLAYVTAKDRMTVWEYRKSAVLFRLTTAASACFLTALALYTLVNVTRDVQSWLCFGGYLISGAFMAIIFVAERKVPYSSLASDEGDVPQGLKIERED